MTELAALLIAVAISAGGHHTPPECWASARYVHRQASADFVDRVSLVAVQKAVAFDGMASPNRGYQFEVSSADGRAVIRIDVERGRQWLLSLRGAAWQPEVRWVNEKLLFVRVHWGRIQASDLLVDVELGSVIWHERADNGEIAYQQFQQACDGRCPCDSEQQISHPQPEPIAGTPLIGLAEIAGVGEGVEVLPEAIWVRDQPQADAPTRSLSRLHDFRTRELGYEQPALEVYALQDAWLQVALAGGERVWIGADTARLHPVELVLLNRFTYLSRHWDGRVWEAAGGAISAEIPPQAGVEKTVKVLTAVRHENRSWLQIEVYSHSPCEGADEPKVVTRGWVPAHQSDGQPQVWFYSRGC